MSCPKGEEIYLGWSYFTARYPVAVGLANTVADLVAKALFTVFSRMSFPKEIWSDNESNFMSQLASELWRLCEVKQLKAAPSHPETNGLVERFSET